MIKLIVTDFDGTLMPYGESKVSEKVKKYIRSALDAGFRLAVSSGRTYGELVGFLPEFKDELYFMCSDGACCIKGEKLLYFRPIDRSELTLFANAHNSASSFVFHGAFENYALGILPDEAKCFNAKSINRIDEIKEKIFKVTSYGATLRLPAYCALRMHWDGGKNSSAQYVNRFCDKGAALSDLQMRLMLTKFDTVCIGDSGNDIAMMHNAKRSFCIGDRSAELTIICTDTVSNIESAFENILNQVI